MHNASYIKFVIAGVAVSGASILFCDWDKYFGRRLAQQEVSIDSASKELPLVKVLEEAPLLKPEPDSQYFSASVQILNQGLTSAKINSIHPGCGCTSATADAMVIPAGGSVDLSVRVDPNRLPGNALQTDYSKGVVNYRTWIRISGEFLTDSGTNSLLLTPTGSVNIPVWSPDRSLQLGEFSAGGEPEAVTCEVSAAESVCELKVLSRLSGVFPVVVRDGLNAPGPGSWKISCRIQPAELQAEELDSLDRMKFLFSSKTVAGVVEDVEIPVAITLKPLLRLDPPTRVLQPFEPNVAKPFHVALRLDTEKLSGRLLQVAIQPNNDGIELLSHEMIKPGIYRLQFQITSTKPRTELLQVPVDVMVFGKETPLSTTLKLAVVCRLSRSSPTGKEPSE
ncbi:MAG: DUF1573 domain-containing protein [Planctomycetaceae bacterium]|nr:DUF1573 domain-containing protein [Planctomycetaceae bacterium]